MGGGHGVDGGVGRRIVDGYGKWSGGNVPR